MLRIRELTNRFDHFTLHDISFEVSPGEYFVILGPSGAGKSVLLETIAGIVKTGSGQIFLDEEDITRHPIQNRGTGLVFQDGAVFPHLTVEKNIAYALRMKKVPVKKRKTRVEELAERVSIRDLLHRMPITLSGGELRRVAIARAMAMEPKCLLLDEPLTALDIQLKEDIRNLLRDLNSQGITIIHVTHDYYEAFSLAHRIAIMENGRIVQQGDPMEIFNHPGSEFVAAFIGLKNYYRYEKVKPDILLLEDKIMVRSVDEIPERGHVIIPGDAISVHYDIKGTVTGALAGKIRRIVRLPDRTELMVDAGIAVHIVLLPGSKKAKACNPGDEVTVVIDPDRMIFPASSTHSSYSGS